MFTFEEDETNEFYNVLSVVNGVKVSLLSIPKTFDGFERAVALAHTLLFLSLDIESQVAPSTEGKIGV